MFNKNPEKQKIKDLIIFYNAKIEESRGIVDYHKSQIDKHEEEIKNFIVVLDSLALHLQELEGRGVFETTITIT